MSISHWYITVAAVRQYMRICGYEGDSDGPVFDAAAIELERLCEQSRLAKDAGPHSPNQQWRVRANVRGKNTRLELIVAPDPRPEGDLPQLIAVRNKG